MIQVLGPNYNNSFFRRNLRQYRQKPRYIFILLVNIVVNHIKLFIGLSPGAHITKPYIPSLQIPENTKGGGITVPMPSCLNGLD
jgi:hypothetical protein